jgi:hypothetical protein
MLTLNKQKLFFLDPIPLETTVRSAISIDVSLVVIGRVQNKNPRVLDCIG